MAITMELLVGTRREGDQWSGFCPSLEVASVGDTKQAAHEATREACHLWIESCKERGTLRAALAECGFVKANPVFQWDVVTIDDETYWRYPSYIRPELLEGEIRRKAPLDHRAMATLMTSVNVTARWRTDAAEYDYPRLQPQPSRRASSERRPAARRPLRLA